VGRKKNDGAKQEIRGGANDKCKMQNVKWGICVDTRAALLEGGREGLGLGRGSHPRSNKTVICKAKIYVSIPIKYQKRN
jgi:hypothetical protein